MNTRTPVASLLRPWVCGSCRQQLQRTRQFLQTRRGLQTDSPTATPFRKQLKEEAKRLKLAEREKDAAVKQAERDQIDRWELTVGIEVHAQLNTERKLFSRASTASNEAPNSQVSLLDVSIPGSQPEFQPATLLPALRAALAMNCNVQRRSTFDRKHYFYPDQPAGYQITQYYSPFARNGHIRLDKHDGIAAADGEAVTIGIKQIQMEQDTAKTNQHAPETALLDFNRVGHPLIEIITLPQIHHPQTAAACVRKIQQVLQAVSSVTTGMELGGLRADVNVSVRHRGGTLGTASYAGITGLGTRTEIKNLSSFRAIEDAIIAERNRQIAVLEAGGSIQGETRGWTLGSTETRKLRGKEGEVDYRYMPDPDLPPVLIGADLLEYIRHSLPMLPDEQANILVAEYGLTIKDAKTLLSLDGGERLDYFFEVLHVLMARAGPLSDQRESGRIVGNWVLHELGALHTRAEAGFSSQHVPAASLATIIFNLRKGDISGKTAKSLLASAFVQWDLDVEATIDAEDLRIKQMSDEEYRAMAQDIIEQHTEMAQKVRDGQHGKIQWLVGQMMRQSNGQVDAQRAAAALAPLLQPPEG